MDLRRRYSSSRAPEADAEGSAAERSPESQSLWSLVSAGADGHEDTSNMSHDLLSWQKDIGIIFLGFVLLCIT